MGSNIWKSLSVLSLGLAALVGCNTPEKNKNTSTSTYQNPGPMKSAGGQPLPSQFPSGQGQPLQHQGQPLQHHGQAHQQPALPFPQQGTLQPNSQGSYVTTNGTRTGVPLQPGGPNSTTYIQPNPYQSQPIAPPPGPAFPGGTPISNATNPYSPAAPYTPPPSGPAFPGGTPISNATNPYSPADPYTPSLPR